MKLSYGRVFLAVLCFVLGESSMATHLTGGEINYSYLGPGTVPGTARYELVLKLMRDCDQSSTGFDQYVTIAGYTVSNGAKVWTGSLPLLSEQDMSSCANTCLRLGYYSAEVELDTSDGYHFTYARCCRAESNNLYDDQGYLFYAFLPPGAWNNSNPRLSPEIYDIRLGAGIGNNYSFYANDPEQNAVMYELAPMFTGGSQADPIPAPEDSFSIYGGTVIYRSGYNIYEPFGEDVLLQMDPVSGFLKMDSLKMIGRYHFALALKENIHGIWYTTSVVPLEAMSTYYGPSNYFSDAPKLSAVLAPKLSAMEMPKVDLSWADCFPDETAYKLYFSVDTMDPSKWVKIADLDANTKNYTDSLHTGQVQMYYKVVPVFSNGIEGSASNTVRLLNNSLGWIGQEAISLKLFPNPAAEELQLICPGKQVSLKLFDMHGRECPVLLKTDAYHSRLDIRYLPSGTYSLCIETVDGMLHRGSFLKF